MATSHPLIIIWSSPSSYGVGTEEYYRAREEIKDVWTSELVDFEKHMLQKSNSANSDAKNLESAAASHIVLILSYTSFHVSLNSNVNQ